MAAKSFDAAVAPLARNVDLEHFEWLSLVFYTIDLLIRTGLALRVVMRRLAVGVTMAWLIVILIFPVFGALVYLLFGELRLGRRRAERAREFEPAVDAWHGDLRERAHFAWDAQPPAVRSLGKLAEATTGVPPLPGNTLELLDHFDAVIDRLILDIDAARHSCDLEFYIWHPDGRVREVTAALVRAVQRGVACRVLIDDVGSRPFLRGPGAEELRRAGIKLHAAMQASLFRMLFVRFDLRLHRKIVVIDNALAYTGSMNLVDPRFFKQDAGVGQWIDAMARVEGPAVGPLAMTFRRDWAEETGEPLVALPADIDSDVASRNDTSTIQVIPSGPDMPPDAIERIVLMALYSAHQEIVLTTPYFVPDEVFLSALLSAAERGVNVTLVVPDKNDSVLVGLASRAFQADLQRAGVRLAHFHGGLLHTKSITIDGEVSLFGSLNLDPRSLHLNFEITLGVYDTDFTSRLRKLQQSYIDDSNMVEIEAWNQRKPIHRFLENSARLLGPLL